MSDPLRHLIDALEGHGRGPKQSGDQWTARCPAHDDSNPSLSIGEGDDGRVLMRCHTGCSLNAIVEAIGLEIRDLFPLQPDNNGGQIVATYQYRDEVGQVLYEVVRLEPKGFYQRRPDGNGGWIKDAKGVRRVIYRLPDVSEALRQDGARDVFVVEGEKDTDRLWQLGFIATTCVGGAGKWKPAYTDQLKAAGARRVIVLADNDEAGVAHAGSVAHSCASGGLETKLVALPGLAPVREKHGEDVSDWLDDDHTVEELRQVTVDAPAFRAPGRDAEEEATLPFIPLSEFLEQPDEEHEWLVDGLLPMGGLSLIVAKPKVGKSTTARSLALSVPRGESWLGRATRQGPVLYLALEEKKSEVRKHFRRMGALGEEQVYLLFALDQETALERLKAAIERHRPALVIIDTLIRFSQITDINDYVSVSRALQPFLEVARECGCHVSVLHHMGKMPRPDGDGILGSTALLGTADTAVILRRTEHYRTVRSIQRYGQDLEETVLNLDPETGCISLGGAREEVEEERLSEAILDGLKQRDEPAREQEILEDVEGRKRSKERALRRLLAEKKVIRTGAGRKGDPFIYSISGILPPTYTREEETTNAAGFVSPTKPDDYAALDGAYAENEGPESREGESGELTASARGDLDSRILPPTLGREGENENPPVGGNGSDRGTCPPSDGIGDGGQSKGSPEGESLYLPFVQPRISCRLCGRTRMWRDHYGNTKCGVCHPPAPEAVSEWIGPQ